MLYKKRFLLKVLMVGILMTFTLFAQDHQLLAHWSFDSTSINTYYDITGNGYNASTNSLSLESGVSGQALNCQGSSFDIEILNSSEVFNYENFTIEGWVYLNQIADMQIFTYSRFYSGLAQGFSLKTIDGRLMLALSRPTQSSWILCESPQNTLKVDTWHHVVGTYDGVYISVFVNGQKVQEIAYTEGYAYHAQNARIGCQKDTSGNNYLHFNGRIDELKYYNYAIPVDSIVAHYGEFGDTLVDDTSHHMIAHWTFDEGEGTESFDISGNGYDVTLLNGTGWAGGVSGSCLHFDGVNDYSIAQDNDRLTGMNRLTVEAWIYLEEGVTDDHTSIVDKWGLPYNASWGLLIDRDEIIRMGVTEASESGGIEKIMLSTQKILFRQWTYVVSIFDGYDCQFYINGVKTNRVVRGDRGDNFTVNNNTCPVYLGGGNGGYFKGMIDEVRIYNYVLDEAEIEARYDSLASLIQPIQKINIGMRSVYAQPGDDIWIPVFIANYEDAVEISSCQFSLRFDTSVVTFMEAHRDSGFADSWLFDANDSAPDSIYFALGGIETSLGYGEGELMRCRFQVREDAADGAYTYLQIGNVMINEGSSISVTTTRGKITVADPDVMYGDVSGNGDVTAYDGAKVLQYVVGALNLPDETAPNFSLEVADVSGNDVITSYDAALILQYSIGLISQFPVEILAKRAATLAGMANLSLSVASHDAQQTVYELSGTNLCGYVSGEFVIEFDPAMVDLAVGEVNPEIRNSTLQTALDAQNNRLNVALITNDNIDEADEITLATITVPSVSGGDPSSALSVITALLNEGRIQTNLPAMSIQESQTDMLPSDVRPGRTEAFHLRGSRLFVSNDGLNPVTVELFDIKGRRVAKHTFPALRETFVFEPKGLSSGAYIYRVSSGLEQKKMIMIHNR